ncbi:MAG: transposase [Neisseriaceae bacterium]|nr:transposase [Neisseriaceae bacterium]
MSEFETLIISQRIELVANNKTKTHFRKAFGCARLAYNWGLAKWKEYYEQGIKKSHLDLKKEFNSIKKEQFPFVYEVSKYAVQQPFLHLNLAFQKFFRDLKKGKISYPQFKKKSHNSGSFYIGGDQVVLGDSNQNSKKFQPKNNHKQYLKIPNLGWVKMRERIKYNGKINSVTISQNGDKFYASFSIEISQEEYNKTHKSAQYNDLGVGIDIGLKSFAILSNGLGINAPKPLDKFARLMKRRSRQLSKKQHPKTKGDVTKKSANYLKATRKLYRVHKRIRNIRNDFLHKLTSCLIKHFDYICLENLNVSGMVKNHRLAKAINDVSFYEFRRMLEYKAGYSHKTIVTADRFYASSKTCSQCGNLKQDLTLKDRTYICSNCGNILDRDLNASINLLKQIKEQIGEVLAEFTPADLMALQDDLAINHLATSKVETGIQQKFYC